jgi:hypothetical protein
MNNQELVVNGRLGFFTERAALAVVKPEGEDALFVFSTKKFEVIDADDSLLWSGDLFLYLDNMVSNGTVRFGFSCEDSQSAFFETFGPAEEESTNMLVVSLALVTMAAEALAVVAKHLSDEDGRGMRFYLMACHEWADRVRESGLVTDGLLQGDEDFPASEG